MSEIHAKYLPWSEKLEYLAQLEPNWDSYNAPAPSKWAIEMAREVIDRALKLGAEPDAVVASADGGVAVCWDSADRHAYIEYCNSDPEPIACQYEQGWAEDIYVITFEPGELDEQIKDIWSFITTGKSEHDLTRLPRVDG